MASNYNPQRRAGSNPQDNDGNLDEENPMERAVGVKALQGNGKLNTKLSSATKKPVAPKAPVKIPRTVPAKSVGGAGSGFLGTGSKLPPGYFKNIKSNVDQLPKRK